MKTIFSKHFHFLMAILLTGICCTRLAAQTSNLPLINMYDKVLQVYSHDHTESLPWGEAFDLSGAFSPEDGSKNTMVLVSRYSNWNQGKYAANICARLNANGHSDWFLPSLDELKQIYQNKNTIEGLAPTEYWSSTESETGIAAEQLDFTEGYVMSQSKTSLARVRCVRIFTEEESSTSEQEIAKATSIIEEEPTLDDESVSERVSELVNEDDEQQISDYDEDLIPEKTEDKYSENDEEIAYDTIKEFDGSEDSDVMHKNDPEATLIEDEELIAEETLPAADSIGFAPFFERFSEEFNNCDQFIESFGQWIAIAEHFIAAAKEGNDQALNELLLYMKLDSPYELLITLQLEQFVDACENEASDDGAQIVGKIEVLIEEANQIIDRFYLQTD